MNNLNQSQQSIPVSDTQTSKSLAPMQDLRQTLDQLEKTVARLSDCTTEQALEIPIYFDRAIMLMDSLDQSGVNVNSQQAQFKNIAAQFGTRIKIYLQKAGGRPALEQARQIHKPKPDQWWWYVDEMLASKRKVIILRNLRNLGIVAVILIVIVLTYRKFFAPDPVLQASLSYKQSAENLLIQKDYKNALLETESALEYTPDSAELLILKGVLQDQLGQSEEATKTYAEARNLLDEKSQFYVMRARNYLMMEKADLVIMDCDAALELDPDSAICYLQQGLAYDLLGDISSAVEKLELADQTAGKSGNPQLQAMIRMTLSDLLQKAPAATIPTPQVEN